MSEAVMGSGRLFRPEPDGLSSGRPDDPDGIQRTDRLRPDRPDKPPKTDDKNNFPPKTYFPQWNFSYSRPKLQIFIEYK